jgi:Tfp pilus assembly protein PilX
MTSTKAHKKDERGFTLFIAVITAAIMLALGLSVLNITLKEFILSNVIRDSEKAFYAADAAMECALYWDQSSEYRDSVAGNDGAFAPAPGASHSIACMGKTFGSAGGEAMGELGTKFVRTSRLKSTTQRRTSGLFR